MKCIFNSSHYKGAAGSWGGGWGGGIKPKPGLGLKLKENGSGYGTGMILVSTLEKCKAWKQNFLGWPDDEGGGEHIADQCKEKHAHIFEKNTAY